MKRSWLAIRIVVLVLLLMFVLGCGLSNPSPTPAIMPMSPTSTSRAVVPTSPPVSVRGLISSWREGIPINGRQVALCQIIGGEGELPADCMLMESAVTTDSEGRFEVYGVPSGRYYILYDSGRMNFDTALEGWGGKTLDWDDMQQQAELFGMEESDEGWALLLMPGGYMTENSLGLRYFKSTLLLGDSPFVVAHDVGAAVEEEVLELVVVDVVQGQIAEVEFPVVAFQEGDFSGIAVRLMESDKPTVPPTPVTTTATPVPPSLLLGEIMGVLVDKDTGKPFQASLNLFREQLNTETEAELAEIQEYLDKAEFQIDDQGAFHFTGVPPGKYVLFTTQYGILTDSFTVSPGQVTDLGEIQVAR
jgi:hypothetical protein